MNKKRCYCCDTFKKIHEFNADSSRRDGLDARCRGCKSEYHANRREQVNARRRELRKRNRA